MQQPLSLQALRVGGYVKDHSIQYDANGETLNFIMTDRLHDIEVHYRGLCLIYFEKDKQLLSQKIRYKHHLSKPSSLKHDENTFESRQEKIRDVIMIPELAILPSLALCLRLFDLQHHLLRFIKSENKLTPGFLVLTN